MRFGESIIILGGYTESSSESENDGFFESSLNSSRAASLNGVTKTSYFPLDEAVIIEIGHHVDNTSPELESTMGNRASAIQKP